MTALVMTLLLCAGCPRRKPPRPSAASVSPVTSRSAPIPVASIVPSSSASLAPPALPAAIVGPPRAAAVARKNFPCHDCELRLPPSADSARPAPLLVVLHGDLGDVWRMTRVWSAAAQADGMILASLRCPKDQGCGSSWWKWYLTAKHDPAWIGAQIDAIAREVPVDARRIYAAGYSGGASYLGYYVPSHPLTFAAVSYVAGGVQFASECSTCKTPVHFLLGNQDPMLGLFTDRLHKWYESCGGHPMVWKVLPGVSHEGIVDLVQTTWARSLNTWLLQYELTCSAEGQTPSPATKPQ